MEVKAKVLFSPHWIFRTQVLQVLCSFTASGLNKLKIEFLSKRRNIWFKFSVIIYELWGRFVSKPSLLPLFWRLPVSVCRTEAGRTFLWSTRKRRRPGLVYRWRHKQTGLLRDRRPALVPLHPLRRSGLSGKALKAVSFHATWSPELHNNINKRQDLFQASGSEFMFQYV